MYENTAAEFRPELHAVVMQAHDVDRKFIAERIFPIYPVETRTGDYMRINIGKGGLLTTEGSDSLLRAPGTPYKEVGRTTEKDGWNCQDRGLTEPVDDVNAQNVARFFDSEAASAKLCERNVRIAYEQRVGAKVLHATNWGTPTTPVAAYTAANIATVDFATDMKKIKRLVGKRGENPNTLAMNKQLWDFIISTTLLRQYFFGQNGGNAMITMDMIAEKFELEQILVSEAAYSASKKGKDATDADLKYIWAPDYFWVGDVRGGAPEEGGAGRTFVLAPLASELIIVESYRKEDIRSDVIRVRQDTDEKVINANCGAVLATSTDLTP